jgi:hypothetical protein
MSGGSERSSSRPRARATHAGRCPRVL